MNIAVVTMMITMEMLVMNNTMKMTMTMPMMQMRMVMLMMMLMVMMMMMMMMMIIPAHRQLHYSSVYPTRAVERSPSATIDGLGQRSRRSSNGPGNHAAFRLAMEMAGSVARLSVLPFKELPPVRRLPRVDDAPGASAYAVANVHEVSARGCQAAMS